MAQSIAATISKSTGPITVTRDGNNITLKAGDSVYTTDTIITGMQTVELSFTDGASATLSPETTMTVQEFSVDMAAPSFVLNLAQGAMRTISGEVVDQNPDAFKIVTPKATVGIRGTTVNTQVKGDGSEVHAVENLSQGHNVTVTAADGTLITISSINQGALIGAQSDSEATPYNFTPAEMKQLVGVIIGGLETLAGDDAEAEDDAQDDSNEDGEDGDNTEGEEETNDDDSNLSVELDQSLISALSADSLDDLVEGLESAGIDVVGLGEDLSLDSVTGGTSGSDSIITDSDSSGEGEAPLVLTTVHAPASGSFFAESNLTSGTAANTRLIIDRDTNGDQFSGDVDTYDGSAGSLTAGHDEINAQAMTDGRLVGDANSVSGGNFTAGNDTINATSKNGGNSIYGDVADVIVPSDQPGASITISFGDDSINVSGALTNTSISGDANMIQGDVNITRHGNDYISVGSMTNARISGDFIEGPDGGGNDTIVVGTMNSGDIFGGAGNDNITVTTLVEGFVKGDAGNDSITITTMNDTDLTGLLTKVDGGDGVDTIRITGSLNGGSLELGDSGNTVSVNTMTGGFIRSEAYATDNIISITNGMTGGQIIYGSGGDANITISGRLGDSADSRPSISLHTTSEGHDNVDDVIDLRGVTGTNNHIFIQDFEAGKDKIYFGNHTITNRDQSEFTDNNGNSITIYFG